MATLEQSGLVTLIVQTGDCENGVETHQRER